MTTTAEITLYHYDEDAEAWTICYTGRAHIYLVHAVKVGKDMAKADTSVVRIPTIEELTINAGDKIVLGITDAPSPPPDGVLTITGWRDRRIGTQPHWRIDIS